MKLKFFNLFVLLALVLAGGASLKPQTVSAVNSCGSVSVSVDPDFSVAANQPFTINWSADWNYNPAGGALDEGATYHVGLYDTNGNDVKDWTTDTGAGQQAPTSGSASISGITSNASYTVTATITSCDGVSDSQTTHVSVNSASTPPPGDNGGNGTSGCVVDNFIADNQTPDDNTGTALHYTLEMFGPDSPYTWHISSNGSTQPSPTSGTNTDSTVSTGNLTSPQTYTLSCGNESQQVTVVPKAQTQTQPNPPTIDLKFNNSNGPVNLTYGTSGTLSWTVSNANSCSASGGWSGSRSVSGGSESSGNLTSSKFYTLSCFNATSSVSDSVEVDVGGQPVPVVFVPPPHQVTSNSELCSVSANKSADGTHEDVTIGATTGDGTWDGDAHEYQVDCTNDGSYESTQYQTTDPFTFNQVCNYAPGSTVHGYSRNLNDDGLGVAECTATVPIVDTTPPPPPTNPIGVCSPNGKSATISWTPAPGYTHVYLRDQIDGAGFQEYDDDYVGNSYSWVSTPGTTYTWWVHTRDTTNGQNSDAVEGTVNCAITNPVTLNNVTITNHGSGTLTNNQVTADNASTYDIKVTATDTTGTSSFNNLGALINLQGANGGQDRGLLYWLPSDLSAFQADPTDWQEPQSCGSGNGAAVYKPGYGSGYIHLQSCAVQDSGNQRTVTFVVTFDPQFTTPTTNNDISGYAQDIYNYSVGWNNFDINFGLTPPAQALAVNNVTITPVSPATLPVKTGSGSEYDITVNASDLSANNIPNEYAIINTQGPNTGTYRGFLTWYFDATYGGWPGSIACGGSGLGIGAVQPGYGSQYVHLVSCTASSGTSRLITFRVYFDSSFTAPTIQNTLSGYALNTQGTILDWTPGQAFDLYVAPTTSGTLSASPNPCSIAVGQTTCNTTVTWSTANPQGTSAVTSAGIPDVNGNSGSQGYSIPHTGRIFYLYNNGTQLASVGVTAACAAGLSWNGTSCVASVLSASHTTIYSGDSVVLSWATAAGSCTGTNFSTGNLGSGSTSPALTPTATTTYSVACNDGSSGSVTVTVKKKPAIIEN